MDDDYYFQGNSPANLINGERLNERKSKTSNNTY